MREEYRGQNTKLLEKLKADTKEKIDLVEEKLTTYFKHQLFNEKNGIFKRITDIQEDMEK